MKKSNHGGAREGAGRPATIEDAVPRRTIEALDSAALRADSDRPSIATGATVLANIGELQRVNYHRLPYATISHHTPLTAFLLW